ncbi:NEQ483 [Nanoarchaeum equitans Kin4-M]|uniref:NEQ483 n=1 Tax=Nanoarchaeum equitans (strain Kin4-M) TaxID=228908 RepID=Q74MZ2_NANEQ|nr:NEQ483 [Nanoarchaeum equitans Kin4-M]
MNKILAALSYLNIFLWIIIYSLFKDDPYINSHLKYALIVNLIGIIQFLLGISGLYFVSYPLLIFYLIILIYGIVNALLGNDSPEYLQKLYEPFSNYLDQYF